MVNRYLNSMLWLYPLGVVAMLLALVLCDVALHWHEESVLNILRAYNWQWGLVYTATAQSVLWGYMLMCFMVDKLMDFTILSTFFSDFRFKASCVGAVLLSVIITASVIGINWNDLSAPLRH